MATLLKSPSAPAFRIMIVDDYADAAEPLALLLTLSGHTVRVATNAADAISSFDDFHPDFCFIEIGASDLDGCELARSLRKQSGTHRSCLVALTGYGRDEDIRASLAAGFEHYLVKPVAMAQVDSLFAGARG